MEVWLCSDDEEIPLFKVEQISSRMVTAYLPSEAGRAFEVRLDNLLDTGEDLVYETHIDGRKMENFTAGPNETSYMEGVYIRSGVYKPFVFSDLRVTEDDDEGHSADLSKLGLIEVFVWRAHVTIVGPSLNADIHIHSIQAEVEPVSEKAKKIGWHSVKLGNEVQVDSELDDTEAVYIDVIKSPFAVFAFRYRPRELLEDQGIIPKQRLPRSSDKTPGTKEPKAEDVSQPLGETDSMPSHRTDTGSVIKDESPQPEMIDLTPPSPIRVGEFNGTVIDLTLD